MNGIIGMSNLLLDTKLSDEQLEFSQTITRSAEELLTVINDILDFSRVEAGKLELDPRPFSLRSCLEDAIDLVAVLAAGKNLDLAYEIAPDTPINLVGDATRLRQIIINLLNNAVKFTDEGEVILSVESEGVSVEPGSSFILKVTVRDTGIGIPCDLLDRLFKSFSQVDTSSTRRHGGTGLGLSISERLVRLMHGRCWVESVEHKGSAFHFTVVLDISSRNSESDLDNEQPYSESDLDNEQPYLAGKKLLIVNGSAAIRRIISLQTQSWSLIPTAVSRPMHVFHRLDRGETFDAAIIDMQLHDMGGMELATKIRMIKHYENMPIIFLSSLGSQASKGREELAGRAFSEILSKPVKPSPLLNALLGALSTAPNPLLKSREIRKSPFNGKMSVTLPLRILLADDHPTNQQMGRMVLARLGYQADIVSNGNEVISALKNKPYDLVLMDIEMPHMDGVEATMEIRRRWGDKGPFIVAITANAMYGDRDRYLQVGMNDYVSKPIRIEALVDALSGAYKKISGSIEKKIQDHTLYTSPTRVIDTESIKALKEQIGGNSADLAILIESMLTHGPILCDELRQAFIEQDYQTLYRVAHTMKASARDFGAVGLAEISAELESKAKANELSEIKGLIVRFTEEYRIVDSELRGMLLGEKLRKAGE